MNLLRQVRTFVLSPFFIQKNVTDSVTPDVTDKIQTESEITPDLTDEPDIEQAAGLRM